MWMSSVCEASNTALCIICNRRVKLTKAGNYGSHRTPRGMGGGPCIAAGQEAVWWFEEPAQPGRRYFDDASRAEWEAQHVGV